MFKTSLIAIVLLAAQQAPPTTPAGCLKDVRDYAAKGQRDVLSTPVEQRAALVSKINRDKAAMAKACAVRFDTRAIAEKDLVALSDLYMEAGQADKSAQVLSRALASNGLPATDRAGM